MLVLLGVVFGGVDSGGVGIFGEDCFEKGTQYLHLSFELLVAGGDRFDFLHGKIDIYPRQSSAQEGLMQHAAASIGKTWGKERFFVFAPTIVDVGKNFGHK